MFLLLIIIVQSLVVLILLTNIFYNFVFPDFIRDFIVHAPNAQRKIIQKIFRSDLVVGLYKKYRKIHTLSSL